MIAVVKVGGSLFDWPELGPRLRKWLATLSPARILLIPGGGAIVDVLRNLDQCHALGEEAAHWLALRALTVNAHLLSTMLAPLQATVVEDFPECRSAWADEKLPILDAFQFHHDFRRCVINYKGVALHLAPECAFRRIGW